LPPPSATPFPYTTLFRSQAPRRERAIAPYRAVRVKVDRQNAVVADHPNATRERTIGERARADCRRQEQRGDNARGRPRRHPRTRSEEHTSELQSLAYVVC